MPFLNPTLENYFSSVFHYRRVENLIKPLMVCCTYCWLLMGLLGLSYEVSKPLNQISYNCEGLGLRELPEQLPFTTEVLDFSFNFLHLLQQSTFSRLKALVHLDLTRCQINWVYEGTFENNIFLETVVFTGNNLLFLASTAFTGPQCLKHLDLTQTGITKLTFIPLQDLYNIETLLLGSNHIQTLELLPNFPTRKLKHLDLQMNNIQTISTRGIEALKQANNLTLSLRDNKIMHIEPKAFSSFSFYSLDFGSCSNISLILDGLQGVSTAILWLGSFSGVNSLPIQETTLQGICNISVDYLTLQYHSFLEPSGDTFQCLSKLKRLDLTHTSLSELRSLPQMNLLKELKLSWNYFLNLCDIDFSAFPSLTHLYIQQNYNKMNLSFGCLESLSKLQHLDLSRSKIGSLDCCSNSLHGLTGLQHLNLSHNRKLSFHNTAFNECPNLKVLDLSFTHIIINNSQGPFHNLHSLQILNLSFSHIDTSKQNILQGLSSLIVLNMNGNTFKSGTILNDNFLQKAPNLEVLTLASCQLMVIEAKAFSALSTLKHVDLKHNNLTAFYSDVFSSLRNIYLNFANNRIHIIPHDLLTGLSGQSIINLSYNPLECTCSNIGLLTWYKQNIDKIEDFEQTLCAEPKSLAGTKLFSINLSCGYSTAQIALITLVVIIPPSHNSHGALVHIVLINTGVSSFYVHSASRVRPLLISGLSPQIGRGEVQRKFNSDTVSVLLSAEEEKLLCFLTSLQLASRGGAVDSTLAFEEGKTGVFCLGSGQLNGLSSCFVVFPTVRVKFCNVVKEECFVGFDLLPSARISELLLCGLEGKLGSLSAVGGCVFLDCLCSFDPRSRGLSFCTVAATIVFSILTELKHFGESKALVFGLGMPNSFPENSPVMFSSSFAGCLSISLTSLGFILELDASAFAVSLTEESSLALRLEIGFLDCCSIFTGAAVECW
ncbi:hypothetical protein E2320_017975, partial [Naja naja]